MSDYTPISCAHHSEYELLAMQRQRVELQIRESSERITGIVVDIVARSGAEYMVLTVDGGTSVEVRLDHIAAATPL